MQSIDDGLNWTTIYTWDANNSPSNTGDNVTIDIASVTSATSKFAVFALEGSTSGGDLDFFIDNFAVRTPPSCFVPTALAASNVTVSSADFSWTAGANETAWNVEYDTIGYTQGTVGTLGGTLAVTTNPYTLTGLTANTEYDIYIQADCGNGDVSAWVGPVSFTTNCSPVADFTENFDAATAIPSCFGSIVVGTINTGVLFNAPSSGNNSIFLKKYQPTETATLLLPTVSTLGSNYRLKFSVMNLSTSGSGVMDVGTVDANDIFTSFQQITINSNQVYESQTIDFSSYTGTDNRIAITGLYNATANAGSGLSRTLIDNVVWEQNPSCLEPSALAASNLTPNSVDIGWTAGANETAWNVEYGTDGFVQGAGTTVAVTTNPYTLLGLTENTAYDVYIQADCGSGDVSQWVGPISFRTPGDCNSSGTYTYGPNEGSNNALNFVANTTGDYITLTFTSGSTEAGFDNWVIKDAANGTGNTIATGSGNILSTNNGVFESTTGVISFYIDSDGSVNGTTFAY